MVLDELEYALGPQEVAAARKGAERLIQLLDTASPGSPGSTVRTALVAYGGGKDSSYMLAISRYMQLYLARAYQRALTLRVVTSRHPGMPAAVMANIDRTYRALRLYADAHVELLLLDADRFKPFSADLPIPSSLVEASRLSILMTGHRCYGNGRPTFCNACNLGMVAALDKGIWYKRKADVVLTGDSRAEQRAYVAWLRGLGRQLSRPTVAKKDFRDVVQLTSEISHWYSCDVHGDCGGASVSGEPEPETRQTADDRAVPFFSPYEETEYSAGGHWHFLTEYLGFRFDELAFSFTESDCANPAVMAHLRGLRAERVLGTTYAAGVLEYLDFGIDLMRRKDFPDSLITRMVERYSGPTAIAVKRRAMEEYALSAYGLTTPHLVCMVFSPFASRGHHLNHYLESEAPELYRHVPDIHGLLTSHGEACVRHQLIERLGVLTGLDVPRLRHLYHSELAWKDPGSPISERTAVGRVLIGDPHKATVLTRDATQELIFPDHISGR